MSVFILFVEVIAAQGKRGSYKGSKVSPCSALPYSSDDTYLVLGRSIGLSEEQEKKSKFPKEEGRGIYDNITKIHAYLPGGNVGALTIMLVAALVGCLTAWATLGAFAYAWYSDGHLSPPSLTAALWDRTDVPASMERLDRAGSSPVPTRS